MIELTIASAFINAGQSLGGYTIEYRRRTRFFDAGNDEAYSPVESRPLTSVSAADTRA